MKVTPKTVDAEIRLADARAKALRAYRDWTRCPSAELRAVAERKRENWRKHSVAPELMGWIKWDGFEKDPIVRHPEAGVVVIAVSRRGNTYRTMSGNLHWSHCNTGSDIVRYRVVSQ